LLNVCQSLQRAGQVGGLLVERQRRVGAAEDEVATHAGGQIENDVDAGRPDPLYDLPVERGITRAAPSLWIAYVDVSDRRTGPRRPLGGVRRGWRLRRRDVGRVVEADPRRSPLPAARRRPARP